jgi:uncharacterized membrane protein YphA (DoxX/SURF4 family)
LVEIFLQRLFSTFADGWPGVGLLLLRLLTGITLICVGIGSIRDGASTIIVFLEVIGVACGIVLLLGLFTPVAGILAALAKLCIATSELSAHSSDLWLALAQGTMAAALAMIGPGALSIDARRYGRKHINLTDN